MQRATSPRCPAGMRWLACLIILVIGAGDAGAIPIDPRTLLPEPFPPPGHALPSHPSIYVEDVAELAVAATTHDRLVPIHLQHLPHGLLRIELHIFEGPLDLELRQPRAGAKTQQYHVSPGVIVSHDVRATRVGVHGDRWAQVHVAVDSDAVFATLEWSDGETWLAAPSDWPPCLAREGSRHLDYRIHGWFADGTSAVLFDSREHPDARPCLPIGDTSDLWIVAVAVLYGLVQRQRTAHMRP